MRGGVISLWLTVKERVRLILWGACVAMVVGLTCAYAVAVKRVERAERVAQAGQAAIDLRLREKAAQQAVVDQQRQFQQQALLVRERTDAAVLQALGEEDAKTDLGQDRAVRLYEHDRWLCEQKPTLRGCGSASALAAGD